MSGKGGTLRFKWFGRLRFAWLDPTKSEWVFNTRYSQSASLTPSQRSSDRIFGVPPWVQMSEGQWRVSCWEWHSISISQPEQNQRQKENTGCLLVSKQSWGMLDMTTQAGTCKDCFSRWLIYILMWGIRLDTNRWQRCEKPKLFQGSRYRHKSNFCAGVKAPWIARKRGRTCESRADFRKAEILAIHKFGLKFLFGFGSHKCSSVAGTLQCWMLVLLCHLESGWLKRTRHGLQPGNLYLRCLLQWRYQPTDTPNHIACHASTASPASPASGSAYSSPNYTQNIMSQDMLEDELPILWATEWNTPPKAWLKADDQIEPLF